MKAWFAMSLAVFGIIGQGVAANAVDYAKDIKPVIAANCYRCHGANMQKGGLRLDTATLAIKGGDTGAAILPGKGANSLLIKALLGTSGDIHRMPFKKPPLPDDQIALFKLWIDQGAVAPADERPEEPNAAGSQHWSFIPPVRPTEPAVRHTRWPRNAIDRFVLARLEQEKIEPSPEADKVTLIRRLTLDLTGLPPTPSEVAAFVGDKRADAYGRLVDRLLASPHYGERWGRHWLDVARYADSNGYSIDAPRSIWKYRDWVIAAFNEDLPYDQFTIWQLAGDLLPNATTDQKIATGFHRNTMINEEGGIDKEQFRIESIIDRVNTTGTTFLGLTVGCCQCHDHKFDPLAQREYYQLFAFFNNADEPALDLAPPEEVAQRESVRKQIKDLEAGMKQYMDSLAPQQAAWEKSLTPEDVAKLKPEVTTILETPPAKRNG